MASDNDFIPDLPTRRETRTVLGWGVWTILILISLAVVGGVGSWLFRWASVPGEIVSPENVRVQWQFAYDHWNSLQAIATQACSAEKALSASTSDVEATQRRSQLMAYEQNYARVAGQYNAQLQDKFRAGLVRPSDVPEKAPTLEEAKKSRCPQ